MGEGGVTLPKLQALGLHRGPDGQGIGDVEWVPEFPSHFWLVEPRPQGVGSSPHFTQASVGSEFPDSSYAFWDSGLGTLVRVTATLGAVTTSPFSCKCSCQSDPALGTGIK